MRTHKLSPPLKQTTTGCRSICRITSSGLLGVLTGFGLGSGIIAFPHRARVHSGSMQGAMHVMLIIRVMGRFLCQAKSGIWSGFGVRRSKHSRLAIPVRPGELITSPDPKDRWFRAHRPRENIRTSPILNQAMWSRGWNRVNDNPSTQPRDLQSEAE